MFSNRVKLIGSPVSLSIAKRANELKKYNNDIIDLSIGQPDIPVHNSIIESVSKILKEGHTGYTESKGLFELRESLSKRIFNKHNLLYDPEEILITPGGKQGIFYVFEAFLEKEDEVIIFEPGWLSYKEQIQLVGAKPIIVETFPENDYLLDIDDLTKMITSKTKMIIINNPVNPTGKIWDEKVLEQIAQLCKKNNIFILTDDIYDDIIFKKITNIASFEGMKELTIMVNGFSKTFSMTGFRVGYVVAEKKIINQITKIHEQVATCTSSLAQYAGIAALNLPDIFIKNIVDTYRNRKNIVEKYCFELKLKIINPDGGIYFLLDSSNISGNSIAASEILLEKYKVATVPGLAYGKTAEKYIRLTLSNEKDLVEGLIRISDGFK